MNGRIGMAGRATLGLAMALYGLAALAPDAAAECDGPLPPFRKALPTADRVVIGEVIAIRRNGVVVRGTSGAGSTRFTLRVQLTPRGGSERVIEIRDLPTQPCASVAYAHVGDRIAIGFGATAFTPPTDVNVIAWLDGRPMDYIGVETTTVAAIYRRLGLDVPDTATAEPEPPQSGPWVVLLAAGTLGAVVAARQFRRTAPASVSRR